MNTHKPQILKSLIIPVYCNEKNIPPLLSALETMANHQGPGFEVVFVVDGSPDASLERLNEALPTLSFASQIISLSRNFGAFVAIRTGMEYARGKYIAVMAADLQEPPELIEQFFEALEKGSADVVFGHRASRQDPPLTRLLANIYWKFYRKFIIPDIPKGGIDVFACNEAVKNAILKIQEPNSSLIAQLFWVGYRRLFIPYERRERQEGTSAWGFRKRMRYLLDSIFSYSDFPIMVVLWIGVFGLFATLLLGSITLAGKLLGIIEVPGYTTLLFGVLFFGSSMLITQGVIGCYLWRALENTKKRPISIVSNIESSDHYK